MRVIRCRTHISSPTILVLLWQLLVLPLGALCSYASVPGKAGVSQTDRLLVVGDSVTRELNGAGKHVYKVLAKGQKSSRLLITQNGIDVSVVIKDADGTILKKTDRPSGSYGPESVTFIATHDGIFILEISAFLPDARDGNYQIQYQSISDTTDKDRLRDTGENLTSQAEELRGAGPQDGKLKAIALFTQALEVWKRLGDSYETSVVHYGLGFTQYQLSRHYEAAINFHRALRTAYDLDLTFQKAVTHSALGSVQYALREYDLAEFNYLKAIEFNEKLPSARGLGVAYHGLGSVQMLSGRYSEAADAFSKSMIWRIQADHTAGKILTGLSQVELALYLEDPRAAETELLKVRKVLGLERAETNSQYLFFLGRTQTALRNFPEAEIVLVKAEQIFAKEGNRLRQAQTLYELSTVQFATKAFSKSLESIRQATTIIDDLRRTIPSLKQRINLTATVAPFFEHHVRVLLKMNEMYPQGTYLAEAFDISEQARSRGLLYKLERRALIKSQLVDPQILERENALRDRIAELLEQIGVRTAVKDLSELQDAEQMLSETEAAIDIPVTMPASVPMSTLKLSDIQRFLPSDTVFLNYSFVVDESVVWVITKDSTKLYRLGSKKEVTDSATAAYRCFSTPPVRGGADVCRNESKAIGALLLSPFAKSLFGKRLIVSKNEGLESLPFSAITDPSTNLNVIDSNEIINIPSGSVLRLLDFPNKNPDHTLAIFADPVYSTNDPRLKSDLRKADVQAPLPRLFASRLEAEKLAALSPDSKTSTSIDFAASKETFFKLDLGNFKVLHFAAHAVVDEDNPELSSIRLSSVDADARNARGAIRSTDIQRLDLNSDLVVLSACRGGSGKQIQSEGFASLANDFFTSGAKKVMFSYWDVEDRVTAETMNRFYSAYLKRGQTAPSALRETMISLKSDPRWKHPYHWAAFNLQGGF